MLFRSIIGDGDQRVYYEQLIHQYQLEEKVKLLGVLPREQAMACMNNSQGVIVPSRNEGLGYTILEAGLLQKPVIASRVGGIVEIIEDGEHGLLVEPENPDALTKAVLKLIESPQLALSLASSLHQRVLTTFSTAIMVEQYYQLYQDVMK